MLRIRRMRAEDIPYAIRLTNQERWGITPSAMQRLLQLNARGCFIAQEGTRKLGLTTTTIYGGRIAWIGNVIVDKDRRGKHVGRSLVQHATSFLQKMHVPHIALYCFEENAKFYENLGFVKNVRFLRLRRSKTKPSKPRPAQSFLHKPTLGEVLAADKRVFGADRSKLLRAILRTKAAWYVGSSRDSSSVSYLVVKAYRDDYEIGPWVCINPTTSEPEQLIEEAFAKMRRAPVEVSCLRDHRRVRALLQVRGFRVLREGYRMLYDEKAQLGSDGAQYALGFIDKG